jgi:hypothetical protein
MRKLVGTFVFVCCLSSLADASAPALILKGSVKDELGAVISNAHVVIHCDSSGHGVGLDTKACMKDDLIVTSDSQGEFSATFPPGFYDVFVSAVAFSPA